VVPVSSKVVSSKITSSEVIEAMRIVMTVMIVVMIVLYVNNFLLVMYFVDKMWNMNSDMYTANKKKQK
jgi:uncharacterized membrane protein YqhA